MSHKVNDEIVESAQERDINVTGRDLESIWSELNRGIVMSSEPLSFEEVNDLCF